MLKIIEGDIEIAKENVKSGKHTVKEVKEIVEKRICLSESLGLISEEQASECRKKMDEIFSNEDEREETGCSTVKNKNKEDIKYVLLVEIFDTMTFIAKGMKGIVKGEDLKEWTKEVDERIESNENYSMYAKTIHLLSEEEK